MRQEKGRISAKNKRKRYGWGGFRARISFSLLLCSSPLGLEFPFGLLVVLCRVDTVLVVVDKVEPRHHVDPDTGVAGLTRGSALHVLGQLALAVELLATLDLVDHFAHVHVDFATVLGEAVETVCFL